MKVRIKKLNDKAAMPTKVHDVLGHISVELKNRNYGTI
nr:MAG TPA: hypothetical protein [Caudoviricetes sp.]